MQQSFIPQNSNICVAVRSEVSWAHKLKVQYRTCDNENHIGVFFFPFSFFFFYPTNVSQWVTVFTLCYCSRISERSRPLKKTVAVDKENTALVRGPNASEDTAFSNENKASCKSRPFRDRETRAS